MTLHLEDLFPEKAEFSLKKTGKTYTLRTMNLSDEAWVKRTFGSKQEIADMINTQDWDRMILVIYHQLPLETQREFPAQDATIMNDEGEELVKRLTGPQSLLVQIQGFEEASEVLRAFTACICDANPIIKEALKKKVKETFPNLPHRPTGAKSSTGSRSSATRLKK